MNSPRLQLISRYAILAVGLGAALAVGPVAAVSLSVEGGLGLGLPIAHAEQPPGSPPGSPSGSPETSSPDGTSSEAAPAATPSVGAAGGTSAEQLFEQANEAYKSGDLARAEALYRKAFAKKPSYDIAANLARVMLDQQRFAEAAELLGQAIDDLPPSVSDSVRARLGEALQQAAAVSLELVIQLKVSGALVRVDGRELGRSPLAHRVFASPGEHTVEVTADGYEPASVRVSGEAGTRVEATVVLTPLPATPVAPAAGEGPPAWPIGVGIGLAAVLAGVGGVMVAVSAGQKSDGDTRRDELAPAIAQTGVLCPEGPGCAEIDSDYASARTSENASAGLFVAGGVVAAATLVYAIVWATSDSSDDATPASTTALIVPAVGPTEAGLALTVHY